MLNVGKRCGKEGNKNVKKMSANIMVSVETVICCYYLENCCPFFKTKRGKWKEIGEDTIGFMFPGANIDSRRRKGVECKSIGRISSLTVEIAMPGKIKTTEVNSQGKGSTALRIRHLEASCPSFSFL